MEFKEIIQNARRKLDTPMAPAMPCKTCKKNKHGERPVARLKISNLNLHVFWKPVNPQDCVWENLYRMIMKTVLQERVRIHCSTTKMENKFIPMPQAMKIPAAKAVVDIVREKLGKIPA